MKARKGLAAAGLMAAASIVGLGLAWNAGLFSGAADAAEPAQDIESEAVETEDDGIEVQPLLLTSSPSLNGKTFSTNGHHSDDAANE